MSKYNLFLISLAIAILAYWGFSYDPRVSELNDLLSQDSELSSYPYQFKVFELDNGTAVLSSPRSSQVSVFKFLSIIKPTLSNDSNSPDVIAAEKELAHYQKRAKKLVLSQPDVNQVRWQLDKSWFANYGIIID